MMRFSLYILLCFVCFYHCKNASSHSSKSHNKATQKDTFNINFEVLNIFPHKEETFTQGLEFYNNTLYETTGLYGKSAIKMVDYTTGEVLQKTKAPKKYFLEGCTIFENQLYVLTWHEKTIFVYNPTNLKPVNKLKMQLEEAWGLCHNDSFLVLSDGSSNIYFLDHKTLQIKRTIQVTNDTKALKQINELEWINGYIYANVWFEENIYKINPNNGNVVGVINLNDILKNYTDKTKHSNDDVLNGIAWNEARQTLFVTGKNWSFLFELKLL